MSKLVNVLLINKNTYLNLEKEKFGKKVEKLKLKNLKMEKNLMRNTLKC